MKTLEFVQYVQKESLESLGTVISHIGENGAIKPIAKNIESGKRIHLILIKEDGTSKGVSCSTAVSEGLRDKSITLGNVLDFPILVNNDVPFISMPASGVQQQAVAVKDLKREAFTAKATRQGYESLAL